MIQLPFKTHNAFNSTVMASFLLAIVSKKKKQTEKNMSVIAMSHKFTLYPEKKHDKTSK